MKKILIVLGMCALLGSLTGCSSTSSKKPSTTSAIDKVLEQQTSQSNDANTSDTLETPANTALSEDTVTPLPENSTTEGIDYDLTTMNSDMVYATVYQMMMNSKQYEGKTIRMSGNFNASYFEETSQYYYYVLIQDAAACCAQGIEFVWGDGTHKYPDEYPKEDAEIVVTGVFETYKEEGDENLYCHLKDATMEAAKE